MDTQERFANARTRINEVMIGREEEVDLCLTALALGEHVLMVAPPGTGKSMLAEQIADWIHGKVFRIQLNKTTEIDELTGPMDLAEFKKGRYIRRSNGKLPDADVALLDEVFKGSSAILNTTLAIMQERKWFNGSEFVASPCRTVIGTSNEFPDPQSGGKELSAMFDRFLFRTVCQEVSAPELVRRLMFSPIVPVQWEEHEQITSVELSEATTAIRCLPADPEVPEMMLDILRDLEANGIRPGDRRRRKAVWATQAAAWLRGASAAEVDDLEVLRHVLWTSPEQRSKCEEIVRGKVDPDSGTLMKLAAEFDELFKQAYDVKQQNDWHMTTMSKLKSIAKSMEKLKSPKAQAMAKKFIKQQKEYASWFVNERIEAMN